MDKNYWDLTDRPHTERKLKILKEYLYPWAEIIFNQWREHGWKNFKTAYYIDCFAGRGRYHKNSILNSIDGSPLIALNCAKFFQKKFKDKVGLKCIFVDARESYITELQKFCQPYKRVVGFSIRHADINEEINSILKEIGSNAALFFVDPWGLKEISQETMTAIIQKKGPVDLILNYICGTKRVLGKIAGMAQAGKIDDQFIKLTDSVGFFHGDLVFNCFDKKDREILKAWEQEMFKDTRLEFKSVYKMLHSSRSEAVYYLFFASRKPVAKKIIDYILKKEDSETFSGQLSLIPRDNFDI
ncbi:MAG: three-Cys-motif partner protein TcmP [Patescibacteria group bacterium]|nr:three-Cys-motif partner protein TcmP [Patescibacteria group bacterium]